mgnify:CR=1 FL=1
MLSKLKTRWGINSNLQILKIFIVFGITGSTAAWISEPICNFFGINTDNLNILIYWFARIILITVVYQFILIFVAFIFGEFEFFWRFVKKFLNLFLIIFDSCGEHTIPSQPDFFISSACFKTNC